MIGQVLGSAHPAQVESEARTVEQVGIALFDTGRSVVRAAGIDVEEKVATGISRSSKYLPVERSRRCQMPR